MSRNIFRQETQIRKSDTYTDNIAAGQAALETASTDIEFDLNSIRSQLNRVLDATGAGKYYDDINTTNAKKRAVKQLNVDLDDLEEKRLLCGVEVLTNVTVPAAQNYVVLSQASSETPTDTAAIGIGLGTVVAILAGDVGAASLDEIVGKNALRPKNLLTIRDAVTKDPITSNGQQIFGLLQAETGVLQGEAFNDTTKQVQISFVRNDGSDDLELVTVADIQGKVIEYVYGKRLTFDTFPEDCSFPNTTFADQSTSVDATLDVAIDNQGATPATQTTDINVDITDTKSWKFRDSGGAVDILKVAAEAAGDFVEMNVDNIDINNTNAVNIAQGVIVDSGDQAINIGQTAAGQIDSAGSMSLSATGGTSDLTLSAGQAMKFVDGRKAGSTYAGDLTLSATSGDWDAYDAAFGEVPLLTALVAAKNTSSEGHIEVDVTTARNAGENFDISAHGSVVSGTAPDYTTIDVLAYEAKVQLNATGALSPGASNDFVVGTVPADGDLEFQFKLKVGDKITVFYQEK